MRLLALCLLLAAHAALARCVDTSEADRVRDNARQLLVDMERACLAHGSNAPECIALHAKARYAPDELRAAVLRCERQQQLAAE